jgi:CheY-like chemotaxis protein
MTFQRAAPSFELVAEIESVGNGEEANDYFKENSDNLPQVLIIDINMPKMNGFEMLSILRKKNELKHLPAYILSTYDSQTDVIKAYQINA